MLTNIYFYVGIAIWWPHCHLAIHSTLSRWKDERCICCSLFWGAFLALRPPDNLSIASGGNYDSGHSWTCASSHEELLVDARPFGLYYLSGNSSHVNLCHDDMYHYDLILCPYLSTGMYVSWFRTWWNHFLQRHQLNAASSIRARLDWRFSVPVTFFARSSRDGISHDWPLVESGTEINVWLSSTTTISVSLY